MSLKGNLNLNRRYPRLKIPPKQKIQLWISIIRIIQSDVHNFNVKFNFSQDS